MDPKDQNREGYDRSQGAATAAAPTKTDAGDPQTTKGEWEPFRRWVNTQIRNRPTTPTLMHGGNKCVVEELLIDGRLRLKVDDSFALVAFDERYIPDLFEQIL
jgi:hypothetical protein